MLTLFAACLLSTFFFSTYLCRLSVNPGQFFMKSFFKTYLLLSALLAIGIQLGANATWDYDTEAVEIEEYALFNDHDAEVDSDQPSTQKKLFKQSGSGAQRIPDIAFCFLASTCDVFVFYAFSSDIARQYQSGKSSTKQFKLNFMRSCEPPRFFILFCCIKEDFPLLG